MLVAEIVTRDERRQFEHTARTMRPELVRAAERMAGRSGADDLVQETLLRALVAWDRVDFAKNPRAWMHTILRNTFISGKRRADREAPLPDELCDRDRTLDRILAIDLRRAIGELPEPLARTLIAVDGEGLAYAEAATREGTPVGTVMSRLHRARRRVIARLAA